MAVPTYSRRDNENADLIALWCLRIFLSPCHEDDSRGARVSDRLIGLAAISVSEDTREAPDLLRAEFKHRLKQLEDKSPEPVGVLARNLGYTGKTLALSDEECSLLAFATLINTEVLLDDTADLFGRLSNREAMMALDEILRLPRGTAAQALGKDGNLVISGLLEIGPESQPLRGKLPLLGGFENALLTPHDRPDDLFSAYLRPGVAPTLTVADYVHVREDCTLLERYLSDAHKRRRRGVNVLVHGPSGTGKTQLARVLAKRLGLRLYEVPMEGISLSLFDRSDRLRAYRLAQRLLAHDPLSVVLFDEIEDLFPATFHGMFKQESPGKALVNELLENNPVPALWLSNNVWTPAMPAGRDE